MKLDLLLTLEKSGDLAPTAEYCRNRAIATTIENRENGDMDTDSTSVQVGCLSLLFPPIWTELRLSSREAIPPMIAHKKDVKKNEKYLWAHYRLWYRDDVTSTMIGGCRVQLSQFLFWFGMKRDPFFFFSHESEFLRTILLEEVSEILFTLPMKSTFYGKK